MVGRCAGKVGGIVQRNRGWESRLRHSTAEGPDRDVNVNDRRSWQVTDDTRPVCHGNNALCDAGMRIATRAAESAEVEFSDMAQTIPRAGAQGNEHALRTRTSRLWSRRPIDGGRVVLR